MVPYLIDRAPQELLPAIPPIVARLPVDTSIGNQSPWGRRAVLSWSSTTPGWTVAVIASGSTSRIPSRCLLVSMTRASLTVWPHCDVPAPRAVTGTP